MKKYILGTGISLCLLMSSCLNDSFLEVYPKGQQTEATVFYGAQYKMWHE